MMSTQTRASTPDAGEPTVVVPDDKATALAGLASSDDAEDYYEAFDGLRDRTTFWLRLYVGITAVIVVALAVALWSVLHDRHEPEPTAAVVVPASSAPDVVVPSSPTPEPSPAPAPPPLIIAAPPPVVTEAPAPPPPAAVPRIDPDTAFLTELNSDGIMITSTPAAINGGHDVCLYIAQGHTPQQAVEVSMRNNSSLTPVNARAYVAAAVHVYCPQDGG